MNRRLIERLELDLEHERGARLELEHEYRKALDRERRLLEKLVGIESDDELAFLRAKNRDGDPVMSEVERVRDQIRELGGGERPGWGDPEAHWSVDGLSRSDDDDPLPDLPAYLPDASEEEVVVEPAPELERERIVGIAPGEDPFKGLAGLDPEA